MTSEEILELVKGTKPELDCHVLVKWIDAKLYTDESEQDWISWTIRLSQLDVCAASLQFGEPTFCLDKDLNEHDPIIVEEARLAIYHHSCRKVYPYESYGMRAKVEDYKTLIQSIRDCCRFLNYRKEEGLPAKTIIAQARNTYSNTFSKEQVAHIRSSPDSLAKLANKYKCSRSTISNIKSGKTHKYL